MPFSIGASAGIISLLLTQPFDTIKVISQIRSEQLAETGKPSPFHFLSKSTSYRVLFRQLYRGLDSAMVRQFTYTGTRMAIYKSLFYKYQSENGKVPLQMKSLFGLIAGFCGALVGNPADLILIRMQADLMLPVEHRRGYSNFLEAIIRITREEGVRSLFRGSGPTVARAMVLNGTQLSSFDHCKEFLNEFVQKKDSLQVRVGASAIAGFLAAISSLPFDNIKTKMQKMRKLSTGEFPYKNTIDAFNKSIRHEGFFKLWVGFPAFYARLAPRTMIILILQDLLTDAWNRSICQK